MGWGWGRQGRRVRTLGKAWETKRQRQGQMETGRGGRKEGRADEGGRKDSLLLERLLHSKQLDNRQVCLAHFKENRKRRGKSNRSGRMVT